MGAAPTEPGFYWVKNRPDIQGERWSVGEVFHDSYADWKGYYTILGDEVPQQLNNGELWGPKIEPPSE